MSDYKTYKLIYEHEDLMYYLYFDNLNIAKRSFKELLIKDKYNPVGIYCIDTNTAYLHSPYKEGKNVLTRKHKKLLNVHYCNTLKIKLKLPDSHEFDDIITFNITLK